MVKKSKIAINSKTKWYGVLQRVVLKKLQRKAKKQFGLSHREIAKKKLKEKTVKCYKSNWEIIKIKQLPINKFAIDVNTESGLTWRWAKVAKIKEIPNFLH